jgi:hypothetical protein
MPWERSHRSLQQFARKQSHMFFCALIECRFRCLPPLASTSGSVKYLIGLCFIYTTGCSKDRAWVSQPPFESARKSGRFLDFNGRFRYKISNGTI